MASEASGLSQPVSQGSLEGAHINARQDRITVWSLPPFFLVIIGVGFLFTFYDIADINVSFIQTCTQIIAGCVPPTAASTQHKNKLTAICDEMFPEFTRVFRDPNGPTALVFRERFSTPAAIATASLSALHEASLRWPGTGHWSDCRADALGDLYAPQAGSGNSLEVASWRTLAGAGAL